MSQVKQYSRIRHRLALVNMALPILFLSLVLTSGASLRLREFISGFAANFYAEAVLYLCILGAVYYLVTFPLAFYAGFVLEHKFRLSAQSFAKWLLDEIKEGLVSLAIFLPLSLGLYFLLRNLPAMWWLPAGGFWILWTIILSNLAPVVLLPLFYKQKPLEDAELKERLTALASSCKTKVRGVFEIDMSRKTKKANAALAGIGNTRRIILGDTLLRNYTPDEIEVVMAHELGHHKLLHIWKLIAFGSLATFAGLYLSSVVLNFTSRPFGFEGISDVAAFPILGIAISLFGIIALPLENTYSRRLERNADLFALKLTKKPQPFISAMTKLSQQNLSDPNPSRIIEIILYNHPPISKRIKMAEKWKQ